jgi:CRP-like cAMP-binding protein
LTGFQPILHQLLAEGDIMTSEAASTHLRYIPEQRSEKVSKPKSTVLFRRGEKASGMFVVLSGKVSLDLGVDSVVERSYGAGALIGLPSTITGQSYSMTAAVTEDADLGFLSPEKLESLLRSHPDLCQPLLVILGEKVAESHEDERALLNRM